MTNGILGTRRIQLWQMYLISEDSVAVWALEDRSRAKHIQLGQSNFISEDSVAVWALENRSPLSIFIYGEETTKRRRRRRGSRGHENGRGEEKGSSGQAGVEKCT